MTFKFLHWANGRADGRVWLSRKDPRNAFSLISDFIKHWEMSQNRKWLVLTHTTMGQHHLFLPSSPSSSSSSSSSSIPFWLLILRGRNIRIGDGHAPLISDAHRCELMRISAFPHIFAHICAYMHKYAHNPHRSAFAATAWPPLIRISRKAADQWNIILINFRNPWNIWKYLKRKRNLCCNRCWRILISITVGGRRVARIARYAAHQ